MKRTIMICALLALAVAALAGVEWHPSVGAYVKWSSGDAAYTRSGVVAGAPTGIVSAVLGGVGYGARVTKVQATGSTAVVTGKCDNRSGGGTLVLSVDKATQIGTVKLYWPNGTLDRQASGPVTGTISIAR